MQRRPVLIMAGGTGGHIYPGLAVAEYLASKNVPLVWLGTKTGLEARLVPERGLTFFTVNVSGLRGKGPCKWLLAPLHLTVALLHAIWILVGIRPGVVLGMGGFVAGPGGIAAWLLRIPLLIHEQNAIAGLTNRLLYPFARRAFEGFPGSFPKREKVVTTGNPVRAAILSLPEPGIRMHRSDEKTTRVLVVGGSQGAQQLNDCVPDAVAGLENSACIAVWHQTGHDRSEPVKQRYANLPLAALRVADFIDDMSEAYAWADLVICRAGALTIAELCAAGIAAILVPYPHSVDNHQTLNARFLVERNCAVLLAESELSATVLSRVLAGLVAERGGLLAMAIRARQAGKPDAAKTVADACLEVAYA